MYHIMLYQIIVFLLEYLNFAFILDVPNYCSFLLNDLNFAFCFAVPKIRFFLEHLYIVFYLHMYAAVECQDLPPYLRHEGI